MYIHTYQSMQGKFHHECHIDVYNNIVILGGSGRKFGPTVKKEVQVRWPKHVVRSGIKKRILEAEYRGGKC